jgi:hypothetical protein
MPYHSTATGKHLQGIHTLIAYRNHDGDLSSTNCGLAAAATALHCKRLFFETRLTSLEKSFPPDVFFGFFGTSKTRVCEILSAYRCAWCQVHGKHALKRAIQRRHPVLVMLSLPTFLPKGHWMVAYAYDDTHVHLTNYRSHHDRMTWGSFTSGWDSTLASVIDMDNTGIAVA